MPLDPTARLDPHARRVLDLLALAPLPSGPRRSAKDVREAFSRLAKSLDRKGAADVRATDSAVPGPASSLPIRIYAPAECGHNAPALIYFHGGGCIFGGIDTHDGICRTLAKSSGYVVIAVGYRKAPEHQFPAAVDDCFAATQWIVRHAPTLGLDPQRIAVGGDSAGGGLAAVVCQMAARARAPHIALQVLICPVLDMSTQTPSRRALAEGYFLDRATISWMTEQYCPPGTDLKDPRLSPVFATDLAGVAPAHIHTAEFDPLCDEGEAYAAKLQQAGVAVRYMRHDGMIHHFYGLSAAIPYARRGLEMAGTAIREALAVTEPAM